MVGGGGGGDDDVVGGGLQVRELGRERQRGGL